MPQTIAKSAVRAFPRTTPADLQIVRILIIDDDPQARALIEMALTDAAFERELDIATNAATGLERIKADEHDIYLVDQRLPDGTGLEIVRNAKHAGAEKPFILMTGYGSEALDEAALREGAADYVEKHLVGALLERSIRYALRNWHSQRTLRDREEQLRQAQKMEAIGRLAGGVAHDFNNLLTAIVGYADLIAERLGPEDPIAPDMREIRNAVDRATSLTRQLLSFSRKQFLDPTVLDLNETVSGLLQMLPRVIGEHIETISTLDEGLRRVKADASQMEQVLVNLVLNARDAMPGGGRLTITTSNVELRQRQIDADRLSVPPGEYVTLVVSDTGVGMDAATRARAFEPFFTTKPKGKGTGLGLATVYGIIDQSGGAIALDSSPGHGTTIRIYLPVTSDKPEPEVPQLVPHATVGSEHVLLVEDNDAVRKLTSDTLRGRGYTVHEAQNGDEALDWMQTAAIKPDLLVTDVVMPGVSGPNLAARLMQQYPGIRVLYMSGYTEDADAVHGAYFEGVPFIQKPFTPAQLAERVRMALDASPPRA